MFVLVAFLVIEQHAAGEAEDAHNLHQGKAAPRFLGTGLGILTLVFGRVGQSHSGAINDFGTQAVPELLDIRQEFISTSSHRMANALQNIQRQAETGLTIGAGGFIDAALVMETKQGLDLSDDFTAGAAGIEGLIKKAPEGATQGVDARAAVGTLVGLGQKPGGDQLCEEQFEVKKALLADALDATAEGGQAGAPRGKEGSVHDKYIYLSRLTVQLK